MEDGMEKLVSERRQPLFQSATAGTETMAFCVYGWTAENQNNPNGGY